MSKTSPYSHMSERQARRMLRAIDAAAEFAGGYDRLAAMLSRHYGQPITPQGIFRWTVKGVPAERAVQLERATGGAVLRQELRPDLFDGMRDSATRGTAKNAKQ